MFNVYFDELEKTQKGGALPQNVHRGDCYLMMNFAEDGKALKTSRAIEKIRQVLR